MKINVSKEYQDFSNAWDFANLSFGVHRKSRESWALTNCIWLTDWFFGSLFILLIFLSAFLLTSFLLTSFLTFLFASLSILFKLSLLSLLSLKSLILNIRTILFFTIWAISLFPGMYKTLFLMWLCYWFLFLFLFSFKLLLITVFELTIIFCFLCKGFILIFKFIFLNKRFNFASSFIFEIISSWIIPTYCWIMMILWILWFFCLFQRRLMFELFIQFRVFHSLGD